MKEIFVYPTSILPEGAALEPLREAKFVATSMQIEVFHILCFLVILSMILGSSWYAIYKVAQYEKNQQENQLESEFSHTAHFQ